MAAAIINFATPTWQIPAQLGKIVQIERVYWLIRGTSLTTYWITIRNDQAEAVAPPLLVTGMPQDLWFSNEHPLGNRSAAITLELNQASELVHAWVEYRYVD
jgi:hypothetical protein